MLIIKCSIYVNLNCINRSGTKRGGTFPHLSCIALDARSWSLRTSRCTWRAYLVRYRASSVAVSPPPTTARTCPLNSGDAPSQIAHALIPLLQNSSSRGNPSLFAVAPVARITVWHLIWKAKNSQVTPIYTTTHSLHITKIQRYQQEYLAYLTHVINL